MSTEREQPRVAELPAGQRILDNIFLLLLLGLGVPALSYIVWGLIDLHSIPAFHGAR